MNARAEDLDLIDLDGLPPSLRALVDLIGLPDAYALCKARGGVRIYIPYKAQPECQLARLVSMDAVKKLVHDYEGDTLEVPKQDALLRQIRNQEIRAARQQGVPRAELARRHNLTIRHVQNISREPEQDPTGDLFDLDSPSGPDVT